jgi:hypothetical protein
MSFIYAVQYLEAGMNVPVEAAKEKLRAAFDLLPISKVIIGWNVSSEHEYACAEVCSDYRKQLYRWQPLLCSDGKLGGEKHQSTINMAGEPVRGFMDMPEFTFRCPNNPEVFSAVINHTASLFTKGIYTGVFLDRIRFPSPMADPENMLACFCPFCLKKAEKDGIDIDSVKRNLKEMLHNPDTALSLPALLFNNQEGTKGNTEAYKEIRRFFNFRCDSVSGFVGEVSAHVKKQYNLSVGLDCFSPVLTYAVGQKLSGLAAVSDWIKVMTYGHTMGVAGLPFELSSLVSWVVKTKKCPESEALELVSRATGLPMEKSLESLRRNGFSPDALGIEIKRGINGCSGKLYAGMELVDEKDITNLSVPQIIGDFTLFKNSGAHGVVLSWDLWHIPLERLSLIASIMRR